jgi:RNA polymerase primary sigma factor
MEIQPAVADVIPTKSSAAAAESRLRFLGEETGLSIYLREIGKTRTLTMAEEAALARRIRAGDAQALNELVSGNLKFVVAVCRNYRRYGLPMTDLINEGNLGLIRAAERFDERQNCKFISYAVWWVRQAILQSLAEKTRAVHIPLSRYGAFQRVTRAAARLEQELGRAVDLSEMAERLSIDESVLAEYRTMGAQPLSLDLPLGEGGKSEPWLADAQAGNVESDLQAECATREIQKVLGDLDDREQAIVKLFFGIGKGAQETLEEIGSRFNLSRERVRQIKDRALERLRHPVRARRLRECLD